MSEGTCPSCAGVRLEVFYRKQGLPAHSCLLFDDPERARSYPRGNLELAVCQGCGFITNLGFDVGLNDYSSSYEETQGFSATFREFAAALAIRWIDRYDLVGKRIIEIGCGKGEFLAQMCELGDSSGVGIDPSYVPGRLDSPAVNRIEFVRELYSESHGDLEADAVVCRHTLEHIQPVARFMRTVRTAIGDRDKTVVLFELPDVMRVLQEAAFWDLYYEHCSYFTLGSLARLFRATGFEVLDLSLEYDGQYLVVEARPASVPAGGRIMPQEEDPASVAAAVAEFPDRFRARAEELVQDVTRVRDRGGRVVIWGSGSKGVAYLTTLGLEEEIDRVVDINPYRQGKFMPGTGHPIVGPAALASRPPELVVAMNPVYLDEIGRTLRELGLDVELSAV